MKKILTICSILSVAIFSSFTAVSQVQTTLVQTGTNEVTMYVKSSTAYNTQVGNMTFVISIADQGVNNPTDAQITKTLLMNNVYFEATGISNPYVFDGRAWYTYNILPTTGTDVATNWPANTDNAIATFTFPSNGYFNTMLLDDIRNDFVNNVTNTMYMYIQLNGGLGDVTAADPFYGTGAVNNGGSARQFVPLQLTPSPVKFTGFSATKKDNSALLAWQITNEDANVLSYEVERSTNGVTFTKVTSLAPKNNGLTNNTYNLTDDNLSSLQSSVVYYRIKQVDKNGAVIYTDIKSVRVTAKGVVIGVYPNPVQNTTKLSLDLTDDATVTVNITDATGREVKRVNFNATKGLNIRPIDMTSFASGSYLLKVQAGTEIKTISVVKTN
ncbi:T9SS type A sorting domain-containing protein [Ferruginibacter sp. SUN002]|uniref:T9SS type A sorting domain-containing protein n=1 Tax=Ferruginibacter sp. SUN002 TaxID=2937789 RepID=UPI003D35A5C1